MMELLLNAPTAFAFLIAGVCFVIGAALSVAAVSAIVGWLEAAVRLFEQAPLLSVLAERHAPLALVERMKAARLHLRHAMIGWMALSLISLATAAYLNFLFWAIIIVRGLGIVPAGFHAAGP